MTRETVESVVRSVTGVTNCELPILGYLNGERDAETLDYEDWAQPLKWSGGRVCLKLDAAGYDVPAFVRWTPAGMRVYEGTEEIPAPQSVGFLRWWLRNHPRDVELVLWEEIGL
jgi:hypothetical protein